MAHVFAIEVDEVVALADLPIKLRRHALSPQHIDHLVLHLMGHFSV